jgi:hypothetical protein
MKTVGEAPAHFKLSEFTPTMTDWGHTGYISVSPQADFSLDERNELVIFFTPRPGTTFEQIETLARTMNDLLEKIHFNVQTR